MAAFLIDLLRRFRPGMGKGTKGSGTLDDVRNRNGKFPRFRSERNDSLNNDVEHFVPPFHLVGVHQVVFPVDPDVFPICTERLISRNISVEFT